MYCKVCGYPMKEKMCCVNGHSSEGTTFPNPAKMMKFEVDTLVARESNVISASARYERDYTTGTTKAVFEMEFKS